MRYPEETGSEINEKNDTIDPRLKQRRQLRHFSPGGVEKNEAFFPSKSFAFALTFAQKGTKMPVTQARPSLTCQTKAKE